MDLLSCQALAGCERSTAAAKDGQDEIPDVTHRTPIAGHLPKYLLFTG